MSKEDLIQLTIKNLQKLPSEKISEANDFIDFILQKYEDETLQKGIYKLASESGAFDFLNDDDDDLYTLDDAIEIHK